MMEDNIWELEDQNSKKKERRLIILIIIVFILFLIFFLYCCNGCNKKTNTSTNMMAIDDRVTNITENKDNKNENSLEGRNIYFAGIEDAIINKETVVQLVNLPENDGFYMQYIIVNKETNNVLFETDLIPHGQCIDWIPGETLDEGTYHLKVIEIPYYKQNDDKFVSLTQGCNIVTFTITH